MAEILGLLAGRQYHRVLRDAGRGEAVAQRCQPMPGHVLVGDDDGVMAAHQRQNLAPGGRDQTRPDDDVVAAVAERHAQPLCRGLGWYRHLSRSISGGVSASGQAASAAIARFTVASGDPSPLSIVTSASP